MTLKTVVRRSECDHQLTDQWSPLLQRILSSRGITEDAQLNHQLSKLADPWLLKGVEPAVKRLLQALAQQQKITIVGDFDADGATSTAVSLLALSAMGYEQVNFFVPNRFEFGYGLSVEAIDALRWQKPDLLITVDNGISSIEGVEYANRLGIDVIVTDHHLPGAELPAATAIVNPNQPDCEFPGKQLAGVGVVFHLMIALRQKLRENNHFNAECKEPNLAQYLDLVALGTVADVVPLDFYNRILVSQGLKRMRSGKMRPGIQQLLQVAKKDFRFLTSSDLGFALGPRLNAAGRLDDMSQGIMLLLTDSIALAGELAQELDSLNVERKQIEAQMKIEAEEIVANLTAKLSEIPRGFCLYHPEWHSGVVGLIASRIKEKYHRPVIAFAPDGSSGDASAVSLKGSARSIAGVHMRDLLDGIATQHKGLVSKFGGHAMAAGLSLSGESLPDFQQAFESELKKVDASVFSAELLSDGTITSKDMHLFNAQLLRDAVPWGQAMPEPLFDGEFRVLQQRLLGEKHLKLKLSPVDSDSPLDAIWFNIDANNWPNVSVKRVYVVYRLQVNHFRGEQTLQLLVEQMSPCN